MSRSELSCDRCTGFKSGYWLNGEKRKEECSASHQYGMFAKEDSRRDVVYCPEFRIDSDDQTELSVYGDGHTYWFVTDDVSYEIGKNHESGHFYFVKFNRYDKFGFRKMIGIDIYQALIKFFEAGKTEEKSRIKKMLGL